MTIDPRLYQKVTGRMPGEAMNRMGESLAKSARPKSPGHQSGDYTGLEGGILGAAKMRWLFSIIGSLVVLASVIWAFW